MKATGCGCYWVRIDMPKLKTKKAVKKRFWKSARGKIFHKKAGLRHLLTGMPSKRGRHLRKEERLNPTQEKKIKQLIPYGF